jgi:hypothetical protein
MTAGVDGLAEAPPADLALGRPSPMSLVILKMPRLSDDGSTHAHDGSQNIVIAHGDFGARTELGAGLVLPVYSNSLTSISLNRMSICLPGWI